MESQPQNPEFRNNPENLHPCRYDYQNLLCWLVVNKDFCFVDYVPSQQLWSLRDVVNKEMYTHKVHTGLGKI